MLYWIFVIVVGSSIGVFLGGGTVMALHKHDATIFNLLGLLLGILVILGFIFFGLAKLGVFGN